MRLLPVFCYHDIKRTSKTVVMRNERERESEGGSTRIGPDSNGIYREEKAAREKNGFKRNIQTQTQWLRPFHF